MSWIYTYASYMCHANVCVYIHNMHRARVWQPVPSRAETRRPHVQISCICIHNTSCTHLHAYVRVILMCTCHAYIYIIHRARTCTHTCASSLCARVMHAYICIMHVRARVGTRHSYVRTTCPKADYAEWPLFEHTMCNGWTYLSVKVMWAYNQQWFVGTC